MNGRDFRQMIKLAPGVYTFFCEAPGHRPAGMYGTLTVK